MWELEETQHQLTEASAKAEKLRFEAQRSGEIPDPPLPSFEELVEMGFKQAPHRSPEDIYRAAAMIHANISPAAGKNGQNALADMPPVEGESVRDVANTTYSLPPPTGPGGPASPKFKKVYDDDP
jgi:hypothetical protein